MAKKVPGPAVNLAALQRLNDQLHSVEGPLWSNIRKAQETLEAIANSVAIAGDVSRGMLTPNNDDTKEQAVALLYEIYAASKDRRPHGGRVLRVEQWKKLCKLIGEKP